MGIWLMHTITCMTSIRKGLNGYMMTESGMAVRVMSEYG